MKESGTEAADRDGQTDRQTEREREQARKLKGTNRRGERSNVMERDNSSHSSKAG